MKSATESELVFEPEIETKSKMGLKSAIEYVRISELELTSQLVLELDSMFVVEN